MRAVVNLVAAAAVVGLDAGLSAQGLAQDAPTEAAIAESVDAGATGEVADPWEGFNRKMFSAHVFLDHNLLVPAAKTYRATTPKVGRRGIRRFLSNLKAPGIFVNDLLQGEIGRAGETLSRFVINTTIGAGGFADPAAQLGIAAHKEDFGQTLAVWGVDSGPFLFLPLVGPTSPRDGFGSIAQIGLQPLTYVRTPPASIARLTIAGTGGISAREQFIDPLAEIESKSLDYYASLRSLYLQSRRREIANGEDDFSQLQDFDDFEDFDEVE